MQEQYRHIPRELVRLTSHPCSWTFCHHLHDKILREFALHDHMREEARQSLRALQVSESLPGTEGLPQVTPACGKPGG